jgi:hypothetical protein
MTVIFLFNLRVHCAMQIYGFFPGEFKWSQNEGHVAVIGKNTVHFSSLPVAPSLRTRRVKQSSVPVWIASPAG